MKRRDISASTKGLTSTNAGGSVTILPLFQMRTEIFFPYVTDFGFVTDQRPAFWFCFVTFLESVLVFFLNFLLLCYDSKSGWSEWTKFGKAVVGGGAELGLSERTILFCGQYRESVERIENTLTNDTAEWEKNVIQQLSALRRIAFGDTNETRCRLFIVCVFSEPISHLADPIKESSLSYKSWIYLFDQKGKSS